MRYSFLSLLWPKLSVMTSCPTTPSSGNREGFGQWHLPNSLLMPVPHVSGFLVKTINPNSLQIHKEFEFQSCFLNWITFSDKGSECSGISNQFYFILFFLPLIPSHWSYEITWLFPANLASCTSSVHHCCNNTSTHCYELYYSTHESDLLHTVWKTTFCNLSSQLQKGLTSLRGQSIRLNCSNNSS